MAHLEIESQKKPFVFLYFEAFLFLGIGITKLCAVLKNCYFRHCHKDVVGEEEFLHMQSSG